MPTISIDQAKDEYDVVIVGSGAGGGQMAYTLTLAGIKCCMLEAGRSYDPVTETPMFNRPDQAPREDELFFPSGENERDLSAVVRDTVLIAVPTDALCSENCRGITNPYGSVTFAGDPDHVDIGTMSFSDVPDGQGTMLLDDDTLNQLDGLFGGGGDD